MAAQLLPCRRAHFVRLRHPQVNIKKLSDGVIKLESTAESVAGLEARAPPCCNGYLARKTRPSQFCRAFSYAIQEEIKIKAVEVEA